MKIELELVEFIPKELRPGVLYVAEKLGAAAHLCPCGCGSKVRTPLSPTDWDLKKAKKGPTLYPSIGNWQRPCQSHYWIRNGEIVWDVLWTAEEIAQGRAAELRRADDYFAPRAGFWARCYSTIKRFISRR